MTQTSINAPAIVKTIEIPKGHYSPLPGSNNSTAVIGPARLQVTRYTQGQLRGLVLEGTSRDMSYAMIKKLKRVSWGV